MKLPITFILVGLLGMVSLTASTGVVFFCAAASLFFTCIGIGGVRQYLSQEAVDVRDIYMEKDMMQKEKIDILMGKLIEAEKQIILLNAAITKESLSNSASNSSATI